MAETNFDFLAPLRNHFAKMAVNHQFPVRYADNGATVEVLDDTATDPKRHMELESLGVKMIGKICEGSYSEVFECSASLPSIGERRFAVKITNIIPYTFLKEFIDYLRRFHEKEYEKCVRSRSGMTPLTRTASFSKIDERYFSVRNIPYVEPVCMVMLGGLVTEGYIPRNFPVFISSFRGNIYDQLSNIIPVEYLFMEKIVRSEMFSVFLNKRLKKEYTVERDMKIILILFQIAFALEAAKRAFNFRHHDLSTRNVLIQYSSKKTEYTYDLSRLAVRDKRLQFSSRVLPVIIDFGLSEVTYGNSSRRTTLINEDFSKLSWERHDIPFMCSFIHTVLNNPLTHISWFRSATANVVDGILYNDSVPSDLLCEMDKWQKSNGKAEIKWSEVRNCTGRQKKYSRPLEFLKRVVKEIQNFQAMSNRYSLLQSADPDMGDRAKSGSGTLKVYRLPDEPLDIADAISL